MSEQVLSFCSLVQDSDKKEENKGAMKIEDLLRSKRQEILAIAAMHGAHNLRVFGSVARGESGPESDLDILVEMEHVALMQDLEDLLQRKVDVVSERALHWYVRDRVLAEATPL
jgi:predicted nucleotidyltransferase